MKKIMSICVAAAMSLSTFTAFAAVPETLYSADTEEIKTMLTTISDTDKSEFIDKNLTKEMQLLSRLVTLISNQAVDKIADEVEAAIDDGLTPVQIKEAIYHSGAYCGYTRAAKALDAADEKLAAMGIDTTYQTRITSTEETRYDDGLAVQRYLFGPQIGTITDGMSEAMKLQTLYLSGICFGDFYNRIGLPLYTREFLTFCTIAGNGNCQGQLTGHTNGNLGVGHSTDMLRAAVLLNADINGEEKTEQALGVINSVERKPSADVAPEPTERPTIENPDYKSDSEELLANIEHYAADDKDGYIAAQLTTEQQELVKSATQAVVDGLAMPTSDDKSTQLLIDIAVMTAQGGRESEIPDALKANIEAGNTAEQMLAVPLACVPYNGFPRTLNKTVTIEDADKIENIFDKGSLNPAAPYFTGISYLNFMTQYDEAMQIPSLGLVTFEPCTRTDWHMHDGGQILLVTEGVGVFGMEGEESRLMQAGDVILIPPKAKHFHSAINDSQFAHIALGVNPGVGTTNWFEKVTDEEYDEAITKARATGTIRERGETMFPKGEAYTAEGYTGSVFKNLLVENEEVFNSPEFDNYTMENGARTAWHSNESGELIVVTDGEGIYQEEGSEPVILKAGDIVIAQPGVVHWYGAISDTFAYIGVNGGLEKNTITWGDAITDEEYTNASK